MFKILQGLTLAFRIKLRSLRMAEGLFLVQLCLLCHQASSTTCSHLPGPPARVSCSLESSPLSCLLLSSPTEQLQGFSTQVGPSGESSLSLVLCPRVAWDGVLPCSPGISDFSGHLMAFSCPFSSRLRHGASSLALNHSGCLIKISCLSRDTMYLFLPCTRHCSQTSTRLTSFSPSNSLVFFWSYSLAHCVF